MTHYTQQRDRIYCKKCAGKIEKQGRPMAEYCKGCQFIWPGVE